MYLYGRTAYLAAAHNDVLQYAEGVWHPAYQGNFLGVNYALNGTTITTLGAMSAGPILWDGLYYIGLPGDADTLTGAATTITDDIFSAVPGYSGWWKSTPMPGIIRRLFVESRCRGFNYADRILGTAMRQPLRAYVTENPDGGTDESGGGAFPGLYNTQFESGTKDILDGTGDGNICNRIGPGFDIITGTGQKGIWWGKETGGKELYVWTGSSTLKPAQCWGGIALMIDGVMPQRTVIRSASPTNTRIDKLFIRGTDNGIGLGYPTFNSANVSIGELTVQAYYSVAVPISCDVGYTNLGHSIDLLVMDTATSGYEQEEPTQENFGDTYARFQGGVEGVNINGCQGLEIKELRVPRAHGHGALSIGNAAISQAATSNIHVRAGWLEGIDHPLSDLHALASQNCSNCSISNLTVVNQSNGTQLKGQIDLNNVRFIDSFSSEREAPDTAILSFWTQDTKGGTYYESGPGQVNGAIVGQVRFRGGGIFTKRKGLELRDEIRPMKFLAYAAGNIAANTVRFDGFTVQQGLSGNRSTGTEAGHVVPAVTFNTAAGQTIGQQQFNNVHFEHASGPTVPECKWRSIDLGTTVWTSVQGKTTDGFVNATASYLGSKPWSGWGNRADKFRRSFLG
jgi:hypothetical protein